MKIRKRRDATKLVYDILLRCKEPISKKKLICQTNLSSSLCSSYFVFLESRGLLNIAKGLRGQALFQLSDKGEALLIQLELVEKELMFLYDPKGAFRGRITEAVQPN